MLDRPFFSDNASIYFPDKNIPFTRIYEPKNRSKYTSPIDKTCIVAEVPYNPEKSNIKNIELNGLEIKEAFSPMSVIIRLTDEIDISRGDMIVRENNSPEVTQDLDVLITWMSEKPVCERTKVFVKHTTNECISMIKEIKYKIDINTLHRIENIEQIEMNDIARIYIRTSKPLFVDSYNRNRLTGSIILIDEQTNETIGAGMILNKS